MQDDISDLHHSALTKKILQCCFEVMNTLGCGFLESVYKNALIIALVDMGRSVYSDKGFEVMFKHRKIGLFVPDIIVEDAVIVE